MRWLTALFIGLLLALQYPLWWGRGGWEKVWAMNRQLAHQQSINAGLTARNAALSAEVLDLKQGTGAIEERARMELGMVRKDELFFQILDAPSDGSTTVQAAGIPPDSDHGAQK